HISSAAHTLEILFPRTERCGHSPLHYGYVSIQVGVADAPDQREAVLEGPANFGGAIVEVIGEQSADTARFATMRKIKILVAGILQQWIGTRPRRNARGARGFMPGPCIFLE